MLPAPLSYRCYPRQALHSSAACTHVTMITAADLPPSQRQTKVGQVSFISSSELINELLTVSVQQASIRGMDSQRFLRGPPVVRVPPFENRWFRYSGLFTTCLIWIMISCPVRLCCAMSPCSQILALLWGVQCFMIKMTAKATGIKSKLI